MGGPNVPSDPFSAWPSSSPRPSGGLSPLPGHTECSSFSYVLLEACPGTCLQSWVCVCMHACSGTYTCPCTCLPLCLYVRDGALDPEFCNLLFTFGSQNHFSRDMHGAPPPSSSGISFSRAG